LFPADVYRLRFKRKVTSQLSNAGFHALKIAQYKFRRIKPGCFPVIPFFKKIKDSLIIFFKIR